ncbi:Uncharacterised protein [Mycobacteroides abscessus subsp. abscessus]|nr:Uncharacterised protein [Mycobacteroides abscessus subsp. abscessus]
MPVPLSIGESSLATFQRPSSFCRSAITTTYWRSGVCWLKLVRNWVRVTSTLACSVSPFWKPHCTSSTQDLTCACTIASVSAWLASSNSCRNSPVALSLTLVK